VLQRIGSAEVVLLLGIALLTLGPSKLSALGKSIGQSIREFKSSLKDMSAADAAEEKKA
jgi:sec-independent protein translocase protein TatA